MNASGQSYPIVSDIEEGLLHLAEDASGSRNVDHHRPIIYEELVSCVNAHPFLDRWYGGQYLLYPSVTVQGLAYC